MSLVMESQWDLNVPFLMGRQVHYTHHVGVPVWPSLQPFNIDGWLDHAGKGNLSRQGMNGQSSPLLYRIMQQFMGLIL